jgi:hypothetical protein
MRTLDVVDQAIYVRKEKLYRRHLERIRRRFKPSVYSWLGKDQLHDASLVRVEFNPADKTAGMEFEYVGEWSRKGARYVRPPTRRLILEFDHVKDLSISRPEGGWASLIGLDYIICELNTDRRLRQNRRLNSVLFSLAGDASVEIGVLFKSVNCRERR